MLRPVASRRTLLTLQRRWRHSSVWNVDPVSGLVNSSSNEQSYQVIVGLEIHAQLNVPTKLFSAARVSLHSNNYHSPPNTTVHPFDVAVPGTLPVLSKAAVRTAVLMAAALNCTIHPSSRFERKHYAYADLPHGYQITQQRWPLAGRGMITGNVETNAKKHKSKRIQCRINRIQLEQDTGKTITTAAVVLDSTTGGDENDTVVSSRVDFNRAGMALAEIVTEPDLRSSAEAACIVRTIQQMLQHTGTCLGKMEAGQLRVDCNVNLVPTNNNNNATTGAKKSSPRVEVKNLNSIKQVHDCIQYEACRQADLLALSNDETMCSETRTWNAATAETELIRRKDGEEDYRFLPEPDLPPIVLNDTVLGVPTVEQFIEQNLPELPAAAVSRLLTTYGLSNYQANVIAGDPSTIVFFDTVMAVAVKDPTEIAATATIAANLLCNELFALVKEHHHVSEGIFSKDSDDSSCSVEFSKVTAKQLGELVGMIQEGKISSTMAKNLLAVLYTECEPGASPRKVAKDRGFAMITSVTALRELCRSVIAEHPEELAVYRKGGKFVIKMQKLFTGMAMAACRGNAHPERLRDVLFECLEEAIAGATK